MTHAWPDRSEYPFTDRFLDVDGGRMHYVDEGEGDVIVFVHGTPTWSYLYRDLIRRLSASHRCVAMDHIGFGLSEKPPGWSYRTSEHARNVEMLITHLGLRNITLVVHDFGGPIGLPYAIAHPENVARLVLFNTWLWPMDDDPAKARPARLMGGPIGRFLYTRLNFSPRFIIPLAWGDRTTLTAALKRQYVDAFPTPAQRFGTWGMAREVLGASEWLAQHWAQRERIAQIPALLLWGPRDPVVGDALGRWQQVFANARSHSFPQAGHFVPDEARDEVARILLAELAAEPVGRI
jgi:haloalkane dehalogenase